MTDTEKLYETLGELLYVIAKADGVIQESERNVLKEFLQKHNYAYEINWSFKYEDSNQNSVEDLYQKVISVCSRIGPSPIYTEFIEAMQLIANADDVLDVSESKIINSFSLDLIERFQKDIGKI